MAMQTDRRHTGTRWAQAPPACSTGAACGRHIPCRSRRARQSERGRATATAAAQFLADESMVSLINIEGQLRASSLRKLSDLVEQHPEESLAIVRSWLMQEPGGS